ncbi:hypothetical protein ACHZ98_34180 [Streptomyces sp. MAR4 CNY-716]
MGTSTGCSAALLSCRLDDRRVTSVDVDPYLTEAARDRLAEVGHRPEAATVDAAGDLPGDCDLIIATVGCVQQTRQL